MDGLFLRHDLSVKTSIGVSQMLTQDMQMGLKVLAMNAVEMEDFLQREELENPALERVKTTYTSPVFDINQIPDRKITLYELLRQQVKEEFVEDQSIALEVIQNIDERGFFISSLEEIAENQGVEKSYVKEVLRVVQTFEPSGVGARDVQESLLLQLQFKKSRLSYNLIKNHYKDLLHHRWEVIAKGLGITPCEVKKVVEEEIAVLHPYPGKQYAESAIRYIVPEIKIEKEEEKWFIAFFDEHLPKVCKIPPSKTLTKEEALIWNEWTKRADWIVKVVSYRQKILFEVVEVLLEKLDSYLSGEEREPNPLFMKEVASAVGVTESTLSRALSDKYLEAPIGLISFKSLFSAPISPQTPKDISREKAKRILKDLIEQNNEKAPLPDEILASLMKAKGIPLSRRCVAKYRLELGIPNCRLRQKSFEKAR